MAVPVPGFGPAMVCAGGLRSSIAGEPARLPRDPNFGGVGQCRMAAVTAGVSTGCFLKETQY